MHKWRLPSFFFWNYIIAPQGAFVGQMNPTINNSSIYFRNSASSGGFIRYAFSIGGLTLGSSSISWFIPLCRGHVFGKIFGTTSWYFSNTTCIRVGIGSDKFSPSTTGMVMKEGLLWARLVFIGGPISSLPLQVAWFSFGRLQNWSLWWLSICPRAYV